MGNYIDGYMYEANPPNDRFYFNDGIYFYQATFISRCINITRYDGEKISYSYDHKIIDNRISNIDSILEALSQESISFVNKILSMKAFL